MRQLLLATHNQGKLHELTQLLAGAPLQVVSLRELGIARDVAETGETFLANATLKAVEYSRLTDAFTLADDSGLEVTSLRGAPGVRSARYGGTGLDDDKRNALLIKELQTIPWEDRTARFVCVLALAQSGALVKTFDGTVEGLIAFEPRGHNGFGYDPVFYYPPRARTFGELPRSDKDKVSHRGQRYGSSGSTSRECCRGRSEEGSRRQFLPEISRSTPGDRELTRTPRDRSIPVHPSRRTLLLSSSTVEHAAVNRRVVGSNPTSGAK